MGDNTPASEVMAVLEEAKGSPKADLSADRALFDKITTEIPPREIKTETVEEPEEPEPDQTEDEPAEEAQEAPANPRATEAREKLRARFPASAIDAASDSEVMDWWSSLNRQDYDSSEAKEQVLRLRRELEEARKEPEPEEPEPEIITSDEIAEQLKEQLGEEAAKLMGSLLAPVHQQNAELRKEIVSLREGVEQERARQGDALRESNHTRLTSMIPQLKNPAALEALDRAAQSLLENGESFSTAEKLYDEAARAIYGADAMKPKEPDSRPEKKKAIRRNQMSEESRKGAPPPKTKRQRDLDVWASIKNKTKEGGYGI